MAQDKKQTNGKDPAVLLYTQDFIVGTLTMTHEERGKYILLLCMQHQKGKLTVKDLKSILSEEDIDLAERFPQHADGFYYNDRMQMEIQNRKIRTNTSRENGGKGGRPKTSILPDNNPIETQTKPNNNPQVISRLTQMKPKHNPTGNGNGTVNVNGNKTVNKNANKTVSNSTRKIIKKALDILIEHGLSREQYAEAAFNVNDIGGLEKTYELLGIRTGDEWTRVILQNSQMYGFNIKEN